MTFAALGIVCWLAASCPVDPQRATLQSGAINAKIPQGASGLAFITSFGDKGSEDGQFMRIGGLAADKGRLYICDQQLARVQVFDYAGKFITSWGDGLNTTSFGVDEKQLVLKQTADEQELMTPAVVQDIVDRKFFRSFDVAMYRGNVMVLNNFHSRADTYKALMTPEILEFSPEGELVRIHDIDSLLPTFLAIDQDKSLAAVADVMNNCFEVYDLNDDGFVSGNKRSYNRKYGDYLSAVYSQPSPEAQAAKRDEYIAKGSKHSQFDFINGVAFYKGMVLAVDYNNDRIQVFREDGSFLHAVVGAGPGMPVLFTNPIDIAVDKDGLVYLADAARTNAGVMVFSSKFKPISKLMHPDMTTPTYIALSDDGYVFITDSAANRVFVFGPKKEMIAAGKSAQGEGT
jgi:sugar lactone lactonase YvrE